MAIDDNHVYKKLRIAKIALSYRCESFIETGTYYGQMSNFARKIFLHVRSVELCERLFVQNLKQFSSYSNVSIYQGRSQDRLKEMIDSSSGRILFWLDGHYSGYSTAGAGEMCPISAELELIQCSARNDHCLLIDDARLFTGEDGYPTLDHVLNKLRNINSNYQLFVDRDCIVALPHTIQFE
jgi:hypothetical protein